MNSKRAIRNSRLLSTAMPRWALIAALVFVALQFFQSYVMFPPLLRLPFGMAVLAKAAVSGAKAAPAVNAARAAPPSLSGNLKPRGRPYLVPIGKVTSVDFQQLIASYEKMLGLKVVLLAPIEIEDRTRDAERRQLIAEELIDLMQRRLPQLANDSEAILLGITDEDIYIRGYDWPFALNLRRGQRFAVISSYRLKPTEEEGPASLALSQVRVRKIASKNLGILLYGLPLSDDPTSLLYREVWSGADVDRMTESFAGLGAGAAADEFKTAHGQSPEAVELLPNLPELSALKPNGRYPCLLAKADKGSKSGSQAFKVSIAGCLQRALLDVEVDEIEIDLRVGLVMTRTSDLFVAGTVPIAVTRCYRLWDDNVRSFGRGTALSWDMFPLGSRNPYTYVYIVTCDGSRFHFDRISKGTGYADALYEHRQTATPFFGARFGWNGNGWDVKLKDGTFMLFPESYNAKRGVDGALTGFRAANGRPVKIERDPRRNLVRLIAPDGTLVSFEYDSFDRVINVSDGKGRETRYGYDAAGRLAEVKNEKFMRSFEYNGLYLASIDDNGGRLVDFAYSVGRVGQLAFADGRVYKFHYDFDPRDNYTVLRTFVTAPDGTVTKFDIKPE